VEPLSEKIDTRKGVKFMFIAISGYLLINFINFSDSVLMRCAGYVYTYFMGMAWVGGFSFVSMLIMIGIYIAVSVFVILSMLFFFRGRFEFRTEHTKNIKFAILFLYGHVMVSIIPILIFNTSFSLGEYTFIYFIMVGILQSFFLAMAILYLVYEFVGKFEKDLLYLFLCINIGIPIFSSIELVFLFSTNVSPSIMYWYNRTVLFSIILLLGWTVAAFSYYRILKDFKPTGEHTQNTAKSFLPKPKPVAPYIDELIKRPVLSFVWVMVIIIALCSTATIVNSIPEEPVNDYSYPTSISYIVKTRTLEGFGSLQEEESISFEVKVNAELKAFYIELIWIDEGDAEFRINQGDCFSVLVEMGNVSYGGINENPNGEQGQIIVDQDFSDDEAFFVDSVNVTITLDYCGDHTQYWGYLPPPLAVEDNSNDYNYYIKYSYFPD
jgi:hypothetical protein